MPEDNEYDEPFTGAQVYCPVCCTVDDVNDSWGWHDFECNNCDTEYRVKVVPSIVAEHAMVG